MKGATGRGANGAGAYARPMPHMQKRGGPTQYSVDLGPAGGAEGNRTPDLIIANDALSQLSYSPVSPEWRIYVLAMGAVKRRVAGLARQHASSYMSRNFVGERHARAFTHHRHGA